MLWRHPLHTVKEQFGSKEALVEKLVPVLEHDGEETAADFKERLPARQQSEITRLWQRHETLQSGAGSREALVDQDRHKAWSRRCRPQRQVNELLDRPTPFDRMGTQTQIKRFSR